MQPDNDAKTTQPRMPDITVTFNHDEQGAMVRMLDMALRAGGLENMGAVQHFYNKFRGAAEIAQVASKVVTEQNGPAVKKKK